MVEVYSVVGFIIGVIIVFLSLTRLRKQSISQGTFALWIIVGTVLIVLSTIPMLIYAIQNALGTQFTLSAIFGISFVFLITVVFYLHQKVDMLNQRITKLVAELGAKKFLDSHNDEKNSFQEKNND